MCRRSLRSQSKPGEEEESSEAKNRRKQSELMVAAAPAPACTAKAEKKSGGPSVGVNKSVDLMNPEKKNVSLEKELSMAEAQQLFLMIFGNEVTKGVLAQWSNQGIRFSSDPETSMGLVQHEGGPCGVLSTIQAFVLKYLLFSSDEFHAVTPSMDANIGLKRVSIHEPVGADIFGSLSEVEKSRVLARSMADILFLCGSNRRAIIASLRILDSNVEESLDGSNDEIIAKALDGLSIETGLDLQKVLCITECSSLETALPRLEAMPPLYRSRLGAMLFLVSALLSRGMDSVQDDRDDPTQPLVTAPFEHASQVPEMAKSISGTSPNIG